MILDNLKTTLCDYGNLDGRLARAFAWLRSKDLDSFEPGQTVTVEDGRIRAIVAAYRTENPAARTFEAHRAFLDIQMVVRGREAMHWAPLANMGAIKVPYDYEKDVVRFADPAASQILVLGPGDFAVFFPSDAHKPNCAVDGPEDVKKITVKVAV